VIRNKQTGFTLIEIIVAFAVLGIVASIAVPGLLSQMPKWRLNGAARQVMGDLMAARMKAVAENNRFRIFFLNDHQYEMLDDDDNDNVKDSGEWTNIKDIQAQFHDVTFGATANPIFYPRGTAYGSTITLTNSEGSKKYVKVALTGRVKITNDLE